MKTKRIPFDLETAKKIQAGEIVGRIICNHAEAEILAFDVYCANQRLVVVKTKDNLGKYNVRLYTESGADVESGSFSKLELEVSDKEPQLQVGDIVRIRPDYAHSHFVKKYDKCIGKIVGIDREYFVVVVTGAFQDLFLAEELELLEKATKHEFKPFDKVLVRNDDKQEWWCAIFSHVRQTDEKYKYAAHPFVWTQCIPYEGNEHLVGTTDKPKEE